MKDIKLVPGWKSVIMLMMAAMGFWTGFIYALHASMWMTAAVAFIAAVVLYVIAFRKGDSKIKERKKNENNTSA